MWKFVTSILDAPSFAVYDCSLTKFDVHSDFEPRGISTFLPSMTAAGSLLISRELGFHGNCRYNSQSKVRGCLFLQFNYNTLFVHYHLYVNHADNILLSSSF